MKYIYKKHTKRWTGLSFDMRLDIQFLNDQGMIGWEVISMEKIFTWNPFITEIEYVFKNTIK